MTIQPRAVRFSAINGIPISDYLGLSGSGANETRLLVPFDLVGQETKLLQLVNMYQQFRIKWIKFEFVPTVRTAVESTVVTDNNILTEVIQQPHEARFCWWTPTYWGEWFDQNQGAVDVIAQDMTCERLWEDPRTLKFRANKPFKFAMKAIVAGDTLVKVIGRNADGSQILQQSRSRSKRMGWANCVDTTQVAIAGTGFNTTALRQPLMEPLVFAYDGGTMAPTTQLSAGYYVKIKSMWEFRGKRRSTGVFITNLDEATPLYTAINP